MDVGMPEMDDLEATAARGPSSRKECRRKPSHDDAPMRFETVLSEFEGDSQFLIDVLTAFLDACRTQSIKLHKALRDGDG